MAQTQTEQERPAESSPPQGRNGATPDRANADEKDKDRKESGDKAADKKEKPKKPFKWTPLKIWGLVILATILIVLGTIYFIYSSHHETTDDAYTTGHIHNISSRVAGTVKDQELVSRIWNLDEG